MIVGITIVFCILMIVCRVAGDWELKQKIYKINNHD